MDIKKLKSEMEQYRITQIGIAQACGTNKHKVWRVFDGRQLHDSVLQANILSTAERLLNECKTKIQNIQNGNVRS